MAIARLSMKVGKAGSAAPHAAYIVRAGRYASRLEHGEQMEASEAGNMPAWAKHEPQEFWCAADANERANGTTYREMEIALPREMTPEQRAELVREFVTQELGERHAYQWAIHTPTAADGKEQPHVHLMFSERQRDGIERDPGQYFKRYNAKAPGKGGARKGYGENAGRTLTRAERADELKALRSRWQDMANTHLERAGHDARIDMRSYADRGLAIAPEAKQLPSAWRGEGRAKVLEFRAACAELREAGREVRQFVPDAKAAVIELEQERARRRPEKAAPAAAGKDAPPRPATIPADKLRATFEERLKDVPEAQRAVVRAAFEDRIEKARQAGQAVEAKAKPQPEKAKPVQEQPKPPEPGKGRSQGPDR